MLDDALLNKDDVIELINAVPQSVFVLASPERCLWGEGCCIELQGLPLQEALALIERELNRELTPSERASAETLSQIVIGQPLVLIQSAAQVREGQTFAGIVNTLKVSSGGLGSIVFEKLNETQQTILNILDAFRNAAIPQKHLEEITKTKDLNPQLEKLQDMHLVQAQGAAVGLASALVLPMPIMDRTTAARLEGQVLDYFVEWIQKAPSLSEVGEVLDLILSLLERAVRAGNWEAVIGLGKGVENALIMNGFWHSWWQILQWILTAAKSLSDKGVQAWALHQLGTRSLCLGDLATAQGSLAKALAIRQAIGDQIGAAFTSHSLELTTVLPPVPLSTPPTPPIQTVPAVVKAALTPLTTTLIVGATAVAVVTSALIYSSRSHKPPETPPAAIQIATEKRSGVPAPPPTIKPIVATETIASTATLASTKTPSPTSTVAITITPTALGCAEGVKYVNGDQYSNKTVFTFDFPIAIPKYIKDNLTVYVNSNEIGNYEVELKNLDYRLFITVPGFQSGDQLEIQLKTSDILYCKAFVPYIVSPTPTKRPPEPLPTTVTPLACSDYTDQTSCVTAGCLWDGGYNSCY